MNKTPLRYPGGKSILASFFEEIIEINSLKNVIYAEPYAGGSGAAINLLLNDKVDGIKINDISIGVYSFWYYLVNKSEEFLHLFEVTPVNLEEWQRQRTIFKTSTIPSVELGFATFFLSRTNRSGILNAGPMGGQNPFKQEVAKYKIDCRYNKEVLLEKFLDIISFKERIEVYNLDALNFLKEIEDSNTFIYLDPPYYEQGKALYINYYKHDDHLKLSNLLRQTDNFNWVLSYDNVDEIKQLYADFNLYSFNLIYTAQNIKEGTEFFTHSKNLEMPENPAIKRKTKNIEIIRNLSYPKKQKELKQLA
jgi:DNA adenine methylase